MQGGVSFNCFTNTVTPSAGILRAFSLIVTPHDAFLVESTRVRFMRLRGCSQ